MDWSQGQSWRERKQRKPRERQDTEQFLHVQLEVENTVFNLKIKIFQKPWRAQLENATGVVKLPVKGGYLRWGTVSTVLANSFGIIDFPTIEHCHVVISAVVVSLHIKLLKL